MFSLITKSHLKLLRFPSDFVEVNSLMHQVVNFFTSLGLEAPSFEKWSHFVLADFIYLSSCSFFKSLPNPEFVVKSLNLIWGGSETAHDFFGIMERNLPKIVSEMLVNSLAKFFLVLTAWRFCHIFHELTNVLG